ncbi:hypothetical protein PHMEG_0005220 [Phytophthora megakarya]|uniref:Transposase Tc1-like domain-containing protein n=1 Tax=Phytophthora megakarya TaxID=4795 RepID=A0A225WS10_9STRA|nr:hypothetical protein PHMEG_0005220 [Phytophthora megakarya]
MGRTKGMLDILDETRLAIALFLAEWSVNGRLKYGAATAAAARFGCCREQGATISKQKRLGLYAPTRGLARDAATPHQRRQTLRAMAHATNIPKTTFLRYISKKLLQHVTIRVEPTLSEVQKRRRLAYVLAHVEWPIDNSINLHERYYYYEF